jgi:hypothetical protein
LGEGRGVGTRRYNGLKDLIKEKREVIAKRNSTNEEFVLHSFNIRQADRFII